MKKKIAIIGGGISGIYSAFHLQEKYDVTLFESTSRIGGHAYQVKLESGEWLDIAFLIFNTHSYPHFLAFLDEIGAKENIIEVPMSFGFDMRTKGINYSINNPNESLLCPDKRLLSLAYYKVLLGLKKYRKLEIDNTANLNSIKSYLKLKGFSDEFISFFAKPIGASVWSLPAEQIEDLPANIFLNFFNHHRVLKKEYGAKWLTFKDSSRQYIEKFLDKFKGQIKLNEPVKLIQKNENEGYIINGEKFDKVLICTHADIAYRLLKPLGLTVNDHLKKWKYNEVAGVLHSDKSLMPKRKKSWSCWNIIEEKKSFTVSYHLKEIQKYKAKTELFFSMGSLFPDQDKIIHQVDFRHPIFSSEAVKTQTKLREWNEQTSDLFIFGSYFGNGFHEDAINSVRIALPKILRESV